MKTTQTYQRYYSLYGFTHQPMGKSAYEKNTGREPNTVNNLATEPFRCSSEPSTVELSDTDFESGQDSTILVR